MHINAILCMAAENISSTCFILQPKHLQCSQFPIVTSSFICDSSELFKLLNVDKYLTVTWNCSSTYCVVLQHYRGLSVECSNCLENIVHYMCWFMVLKCSLLSQEILFSGHKCIFYYKFLDL